jgi:hypothetical protein
LKGPGGCWRTRLVIADREVSMAGMRVEVPEVLWLEI